MTNKLTGHCLCGSVRYEIEDHFTMFHLCHCKQCQRQSGSAHAANAFSTPDKLRWLEGENHVKIYHHPDRHFANAFCTLCGGTLPYASKNNKLLLVPVGTLDNAPSIKPQDNIFWAEHADWYEAGANAPRYDGFPPKG